MSLFSSSVSASSSSSVVVPTTLFESPELPYFLQPEQTTTPPSQHHPFGRQQAGFNLNPENGKQLKEDYGVLADQPLCPSIEPDDEPVISVEEVPVFLLVFSSFVTPFLFLFLSLSISVSMHRNQPLPLLLRACINFNAQVNSILSLVKNTKVKNFIQALVHRVDPTFVVHESGIDKAASGDGSPVVRRGTKNEYANVAEQAAAFYLSNKSRRWRLSDFVAFLKEEEQLSVAPGSQLGGLSTDAKFQYMQQLNNRVKKVCNWFFIYFPTACTTLCMAVLSSVCCVCMLHSRLQSCATCIGLSADE